MAEMGEVENNEVEEKDLDEDLMSPVDFWSYFSFLKKQWGVFSWIIREFTTTATRIWSAVLILSSFIAHALGMTLPSIVGQWIGYATRNQVDSALDMIAVFVFLCAVQQAFYYVSGVSLEYALGLNFCKVDHRMDEMFYAKPLVQHERHSARLNHATIDKGRWQTFNLFMLLVFQLIPVLFTIILSLTGLCVASFLVGKAATFVWLLYMVWSTYMNFQVGRRMDPIERLFRQINRDKTERWEKVHRVQTSGMAHRDTERLNVRMQSAMTEDRSFWIRMNGLANLRMLFLQRFFQAWVMVHCTYMIASHTWGVSAAFSLLMWTEAFAGNLWRISEIERNIGKSIMPIILMKEALEIPPAFDMNAGEELLRNGALSLAFENVSYSYTDSKNKQHEVIRNISFTLLKGSKTALLGISGAGKTTLMKLALQYDRPTKGVILVNGKPLPDLSHNSYISQVGYVPQNAEIFEDTLVENLLYAATPEQREELLKDNAQKLWEVMRSLEIDFGKRLIKGLKTRVGKNGLDLSGGQKQRVSLGAAILKDPRLIVIDEATSSLDSETEEAVQEGIKKALAGNVTALVIAHRLSTVRNQCDQFVFLRPLDEVAEGGTQVEAIASSFEELAALSPKFRALAARQHIVL